MLRALHQAIVGDVGRAKRRTSLQLLVTLTYSACFIYERVDDEGALDVLTKPCKDALLRAYETMAEFHYYVEQYHANVRAARLTLDTGIQLRQLGPDALRLAVQASALLETDIDRLVKEHSRERSPN